MKKAWGYISALLGGIIIGLIFAVKFLTGYKIDVDIRKLKNKNISGESSINVPLSIEPENKAKKRKQRRESQKTK